MNFDQNTANDVYVLAVQSDGTPITGLLVGDFTVYVSKAGAAGSVVVPSSATEVESTGMAGVYSLSLASGSFDTAGQIAIVSTPTGGIDYRILGEVVAINSVVLNTRTLDTKNDTTSLITTIGTMDTTLTGVDTKIDTIDTNVDAILVDTTSIENLMLDVRALAAQAGYRITSAVYNGSNQLTNATLEGYEPGDTPGVDIPRLSLTLEATYNGSGQMTEFKVSE